VYLWADGDKVKKPIDCSAPKYIDYLMTWVQSLLDNEEVFPARVDQHFPKNYHSVVCDIFRKLFRCELKD
jgi:MOB kinase activator 1